MEILLSGSFLFVAEYTEEGLCRSLAPSLMFLFMNCIDSGGKILVAPTTRLIMDLMADWEEKFPVGGRIWTSVEEKEFESE